MIYIFSLLLCLLNIHLVSAMNLLESIKNVCHCCQREICGIDFLRKHHKAIHLNEIYDCKSCGPKYAEQQEGIKNVYDSMRQMIDENQRTRENRLKRKKENLRDSDEISLGSTLKYQQYSIGESIVKNPIIPLPTTKLENQRAFLDHFQVSNLLAHEKNNGEDFGRIQQDENETKNNESSVYMLTCKQCGVKYGEIKFFGENNEIINNFSHFICDFCSGFMNLPVENVATFQEDPNSFLPVLSSDSGMYCQNSDEKRNQQYMPNIPNESLKTCAICSFAANDVEMTHHIIVAHIDTLSQTTRSMDAQNGFKCPQCTRAIINKNQNIAKHLLTHYRKGFFQCPHCTALYSTLEALPEHVAKEHRLNVLEDSLYVQSVDQYKRMKRVVAQAVAMRIPEDDLIIFSDFFKLIPLFRSNDE